VLDVDEFKEVAEKLPTFKSLPDEGKYRTAIGRYYYYIFLKIREIVKEVEKDREDGIYGLLNTGKAHRALPAYFRALSKKVRVNKLRNSFIELAEALEDLRELRNKCDYEVDISISFTKVIEAEIDIEIIEQIISNISYQKPKSNTKIVGLKNILIYFQDKLPSTDEVINIMYRRR
jgi:uncharacterized protein (UPF0332 family)